MSAVTLEIPDAEVAATVEQFQAIGEDPEKFQAFIESAESITVASSDWSPTRSQ